MNAKMCTASGASRAAAPTRSPSTAVVGVATAASTRRITALLLPALYSGTS
jgi:hypothetical protein